MCVCSKEGEDKSHIVSKLLLHKRSIVFKHDDKKYQSYLRGHFIQAGASTQALNASAIDHEKLVISSLQNYNIMKVIFVALVFVWCPPSVLVWGSPYSSRRWHINLVLSPMILPNLLQWSFLSMDLFLLLMLSSTS